MPARRPRMGRATWLLAISEVFRRNTKVADRTLELSRSFLVDACRTLEVVLRHELGNSSGHGTDFRSAKRAYASLGSDVSSSTPAPCFSATSFTG